MRTKIKRFDNFKEFESFISLLSPDMVVDCFHDGYTYIVIYK